jgi:hypothetical protein
VVEYGRKSFFEQFFGVFARELGHGIAETFLETGKQPVGLSGSFLLSNVIILRIDMKGRRRSDLGALHMMS